jgi:protease PrsW
MAERLVVTNADLRPPPSIPSGIALERTLPLSVLLPVRKWLILQPWRSPWAVVLLIGVLAPLVFITTISPAGSPVSELQRVSAFFAIYFAAGWLLVLRFIIRPERIGWQLVAAVAAPTALIGAPLAGLLEQQLLSGTQLDLMSFILVVGAIEELIKWGTVYLLAYRPGHRMTPLTFMYLGVASGLAFGVAEAIGYTVLYAGNLSLDD